MCYFYVVVNESVTVLVGEPVIVQEDVQVIIDCSQLIDDTINNGSSNTIVTWSIDGFLLSNGSALNVVISADNRLCIITDSQLAVGGLLGNDGNYTCEVCNDTICVNQTSSYRVCGKCIYT